MAAMASWDRPFKAGFLRSESRSMPGKGMSGESSEWAATIISGFGVIDSPTFLP